VLAVLAAASAWAALILLTGTNATSNGLTVAYRIYAVAAPALVGLLWWRRRPDSRIGTLLLVLATFAALMAWQASAFTYRFSFGVLAEAPYAVVAIVLCLTFPTGRLEGPIAKALAGLLVAALLLTFVPWLVSGATIYGSNPVFDCGSECPPNAFQLTTLPESVRAMLATACYTIVAVIGLAVVGLHLSRFRHASLPRRRALVSLALTSMIVFPAAALFVAATLTVGIVDAQRMGLTLSFALAVIAFPIGFAAPLVTADLAASSELQDMLRDLTTGPSRSAWRDRVARALDDPRLRLGYWDEATDRFVEPDGRELSKATAGHDRLWVEIGDGNEPIAALATDPALATEPELTEAVAIATVAATAARRLEGTRREVSARAAGAAETERLRIAREIEAGPQQRLAALRVHIDLLGGQEQGAASQSFIEEFGRGVDKAMQELGEATRTRALRGLGEHGLGAALRAVRGHSPLAIRIWDRGLGRHPARCELAVYYCVLEAIQNTTKHGGSGASVTVRLYEMHKAIGFAIEDDGVGFHPEAVAPGSGLFNIRDRIHALGGVVSVSSKPGRGTVISGSIPDEGEPS